MSLTFHHVKEGEFRRIAETQSITKLLAQESTVYPDKFHLVGIDPNNQIAYAVRHGRTPDLRIWRLDNLIKQIRGMGFEGVEVQLSN